jgi:hypothetical protein
MVYIFIDESGDLGFKARSSRWFVLAAVIVPDRRALELTVRKMLSHINKNRRRKLNEFHASSEKANTRTRVLKKLEAITEIKIACILINKQSLRPSLKKDAKYLYNFAVYTLVERILVSDVVNIGRAVSISIDRRDTGRHEKERLVNDILVLLSRYCEGAFSVDLNTSHEDKPLQSADFISWAIFRKYEYDDLVYYSIIKSKIIDESPLYP